MFRNGWIAFLLALLLVGCGQESGVGAQNENIDDEDISAEETNVSHNTYETDNVTNENDTSENDGHANEDQNQTSEDANNTHSEKNNENASAELPDLKVHYMDVGQADATLFAYDGHTILFDTGDWNRNDVINYLDSKDITDIDLVVVSHPHADHIGQLEDIMHTYNVGEVWFNGVEASSNTFQNAMKAVLESDADYAEPKTGEEMQIGSMDIEVLHPASLSGSDDLNRDSLSLRFTYGDISFVFTGDAYKEDEQAMMANASSVEANFLQLGHHGSNTSSDASFIDAVDPDVAIYSAGSDNSYGHPSPETVSLIQDRGIDLYGTDVHGTIVVTTDGQTYDVETKEDGTVSPSSTGAAESNDNSNHSGGDENKNNDSPDDTASSEGNCIDINQASIDELQEIIHIGPVRAEDVTDARPFDSVEDLTKVNGIGPARIDDIKDQGLACTGG